MRHSEDVNVRRVNESFYRSSPADYLVTRLYLLVLAAGKAEELNQLLEAGVEFAGVTVTGLPTLVDDADTSEGSVQRFATIESQQLFHHASETALRMFLVHSAAAPSVPWIELVADRNYATFKKRLRSAFIDSTPDPGLIARVCLGTTPADDMTDDDSAASIADLGAFFRAFAECILDDAYLYNGIKHGLGVSAGDAVLQVGGNTVGSGPIIEYLASGSSREGTREWSLTTGWLDLSYSIGMTWVASKIVDSIRRVGRWRHIGGDASPTVFFPRGLRPDDLRDRQRAPALRLSWRLIEGHPIE